MLRNMFDSVRSFFIGPVLDALYMGRLDEMEVRRNYRQGDQKPQLKVQPGQHDDNLTLNLTKLVISRSNSMLFGTVDKGVTFNLPGEDDSEEAEYIKKVMRANKLEILLHKTGIWGAEQGTCYWKIVTDGVNDPEDEDKLLPRLVLIDPVFVTTKTNPEDSDEVILYKIVYTFRDEQGKERGRRQDIRKNYRAIEEEGEITGFEVAGWIIEDFKTDDRTGEWVQIGEELWDYNFPPMHHWQNLPEPGQIEGQPDITEDVIKLQDRTNFLGSNISKIIRLYAHPKLVGTGVTGQDAVSMNPDKMLTVPEGGDLKLLSPEADVKSSMEFFNTMRQGIFDTTQTVDITTVRDKVGDLTNFGLRVLYQDALAKLGVKRKLYGEALLEIVRRLLILAEFENTDPGEVVWPEALPKNQKEEDEGDRFDLENKLVSRQTLAAERGRDWDEESGRIAEEAEAEEDLGTALVRSFSRGF